jgi:hypothetical protein
MGHYRIKGCHGLKIVSRCAPCTNHAYPNELQSTILHNAPWAIFLKIFIYYLHKPHPAILKRRYGDCWHQQQGGVYFFFYHTHASMPYSAIYGYVFVRLMILDFMRRNAGIILIVA